MLSNSLANVFVREYGRIEIFGAGFIYNSSLYFKQRMDTSQRIEYFVSGGGSAIFNVGGFIEFRDLS